MSGTEELDRKGYHGEASGLWIPDLRLTLMTPGEHLEIRQEMQVQGDDRPGERSAPLARCRFVAHGGNRCGERWGPAGQGLVGPAGNSDIVVIQLHHSRLGSFQLGLAVARVRSRSLPEG